MLYTKTIEAVDFQDVVEFCEQKHRETIHLDYKQDINRSLAKTIAAMANTWGGLIIIGVEDDDSKPKLPVVGIKYEKSLREKINNIILGNVMPPVFPEMQVCQSKDGKNALIVIRVPQSNLTPHAIKNNTKVYIRTDTSNEPEELADIDRIQWLVDRREKSVQLSDSFSEKALRRSYALLKKNGIKNPPVDAIFSMCPLYPFEALVDFKRLREEIIGKISVNGWDSSFPKNLHRTQYLPAQDGVYSINLNERTGYFSYEELNHHGFFL